MRRSWSTRSWASCCGLRGWLTGQEPEVTELASLDLDPVIDPALFMPPPGSLIAESTAEALGAGGAGWTALKTVAGVAAGGLGAWIRYAPSAQKRTAEQAGDNEAPISPDGPAPERSPDGRPVGLPVSAQVLQLLHDRTASEFTATVHEWTDFGAMLSQVPPGARRAGFGGLGLLMDSITERPATTHLISSLRIGRPRPLPDRLHPQRAAQPGHDCLRRAALLAGLPRQGDEQAPLRRRRAVSRRCSTRHGCWVASCPAALPCWSATGRLTGST